MNLRQLRNSFSSKSIDILLPSNLQLIRRWTWGSFINHKNSTFPKDLASLLYRPLIRLREKRSDWERRVYPASKVTAFSLWRIFRLSGEGGIHKQTTWFVNFYLLVHSVVAYFSGWLIRTQEEWNRYSSRFTQNSSLSIDQRLASQAYGYIIPTTQWRIRKELREIICQLQTFC